MGRILTFQEFNAGRAIVRKYPPFENREGRASLQSFRLSVAKKLPKPPSFTQPPHSASAWTPSRFAVSRSGQAQPEISAEGYRLHCRLRHSRQRLVRVADCIIQRHHRGESLPFQQAAHVALRNIPRSLALFRRTKNRQPIYRGQIKVSGDGNRTRLWGSNTLVRSL
jgi:hypothetical protein